MLRFIPCLVPPPLPLHTKIYLVLEPSQVHCFDKYAVKSGIHHKQVFVGKEAARNKFVLERRYL